MNQQTMQKIARTRGEINNPKNTIHPDTREDMHDLVDAAEAAANGVSDKDRLKSMSDAILALAIIEVKANLRHQKDVTDAIDNHILSCPTSQKLSGKLGVLDRFGWRLVALSAVLAFSWHTGPVFSKFLAGKFLPVAEAVSSLSP